jgi:amidohydrolase
MGVISIGTLKAGSDANITTRDSGDGRHHPHQQCETFLQKMPPLDNGFASAYETQANLLLINNAP